MAIDGIHVGDFGWVLRLTIVEDGAAVDISSYTTRQFIFTAPDGTETPKTATFADDGTDGVLSYTVEDGFLDTEDTWKVRAQIAKTGAELTSDTLSFYVAERAA